jgi:antitoxin component YwqK of YwqJK toxin-antitoxin module
LPDPRQDKPRGPSAQKHYYKNSENKMVEQFVAQRTLDHHQKHYYKNSENRMAEQFVAQRTLDHHQKLYYKNSENRMAEQLVAQRTPDHLQKLYYKNSERKGPVHRQVRAGPPKSSTNTHRVKTTSGSVWWGQSPTKGTG